MTHDQQVPRTLRRQVFDRDGWACIFCGSPTVTIQRRQATGMGGSRRRLDATECVTLCAEHNMAAESWFQADALRYGYKVKRNIGVLLPMHVPVWYPFAGEWRQLHADGSFSMVPGHTAAELLLLAGIEERFNSSKRTLDAQADQKGIAK